MRILDPSVLRHLRPIAGSVDSGKDVPLNSKHAPKIFILSLSDVPNSRELSTFRVLLVQVEVQLQHIHTRLA